MANIKKLFNKDEAIRYYRQAEFELIPIKRLINLMINVYPSDEKEGLLERFEKHLQGIEFPGFKLPCVPYCVVETVKTLNGRPTKVKEIYTERVVQG